MDSPSTELSRRTNNLDALRFGAAGLVILRHSFVLRGNPGAVPVIFGVPIDRLGVYVFFVISGYLITRSWTRRPNLAVYLSARALRIFPGLIAVTVLSMFVLGPVFTTHSVGDYLHDGLLFPFALNIALRPWFTLPGVFETLPYPGAVNGSLWTLPVEFTCYLIVPILLLLPGRFRVWGAVAFGAGSATLHYTLHHSIPVWGYLLNDAVLPWVYFAAGMVIALVLERRLLRLDVAVFALVGLTVLDAIHPSVGAIAVWFVLPYAVLGVGLASTPFLRRASRFGDLSYGLYIYAFPVQQMVIAVFGVLSLGLNVVAVMVITLTLSAASWHFVESPAMGLKVRVERRFASRRLRDPEPADVFVSGELRG